MTHWNACGTTFQEQSMINKKKRTTADQEKNLIFAILRGQIAEALQSPDLKIKQASSLELAIGTFAPSELMEEFVISDYPFIGSRYISKLDGCVYIVAGATDDGMSILAYRLGFIQSTITHRGGDAVAITADAWMKGIMILYMLYHASFEMDNGEIKSVNQDVSIRRSYPIKKTRVFKKFIQAKVTAYIASKIKPKKST